MHLPGQRQCLEIMNCYGRDKACLLYTSDAADERSSVDLGGRRIIKKKKETKIECGETLKPNDKKTQEQEVRRLKTYQKTEMKSN